MLAGRSLPEAVSAAWSVRRPAVAEPLQVRQGAAGWASGVRLPTPGRGGPASIPPKCSTPRFSSLAFGARACAPRELAWRRSHRLCVPLPRQPWAAPAARTGFCARTGIRCDSTVASISSVSMAPGPNTVTVGVPCHRRATAPRSPCRVSTARQHRPGRSICTGRSCPPASTDPPPASALVVEVDSSSARPDGTTRSKSGYASALQRTWTALSSCPMWGTAAMSKQSAALTANRATATAPSCSVAGAPTPPRVGQPAHGNCRVRLAELSTRRVGPGLAGLRPTPLGSR